MSTVQYPDIIKAIQDPAHRYGVERLAAHFDRRPSAIYSVLNPWGDRSVAKLGLEDAVEIMRLTGDIGGLEVMAAALGCTVRRVDGEPDGRDMAEECAQGFEAVARFLTAARSGRTSYSGLMAMLAEAQQEMEDVVVRARDEQSQTRQKAA